VIFFFEKTYLYYLDKDVQIYVRIQVHTKRIHGQLCPPSYTKAPKKNINFIEDPGPCDSPIRQKPPTTAIVDPSPVAAVEEDIMAAADLEKPHRKIAFKRAAIVTRP
jgi:hypothetical protein